MQELLDVYEDNWVSEIDFQRIKALGSYEHLHFSQVGTCELHELPYLCYEQKL